jgi:hypothetical protein
VLKFKRKFRRLKVKMDLQDVGWGMNWIDQAQDRDRWQAVVNGEMNRRFP